MVFGSIKLILTRPCNWVNFRSNHAYNLIVVIFRIILYLHYFELVFPSTSQILIVLHLYLVLIYKQLISLYYFQLLYKLTEFYFTKGSHDQFCLPKHPERSEVCSVGKIGRWNL